MTLIAGSYMLCAPRSAILEASMRVSYREKSLCFLWSLSRANNFHLGCTTDSDIKLLLHDLPRRNSRSRLVASILLSRDLQLIWQFHFQNYGTAMVDTRGYASVDWLWSLTALQLHPTRPRSVTVYFWFDLFAHFCPSHYKLICGVPKSPGCWCLTGPRSS